MKLARTKQKIYTTLLTPVNETFNPFRSILVHRARDFYLNSGQNIF